MRVDCGGQHRLCFDMDQQHSLVRVDLLNVRPLNLLHMLLPTLTTWRAQYERLLRSYHRVNQPYESSVAYDDDLQHYFQDCWHLKDWIKNDTGANAGKQIEGEVDAHRSLRIVADLANGSKHLSRHAHREGAYVTSKSVVVSLGRSKPVEVSHAVTLTDGTVFAARTLVHESFQAWESVLRKLGLIQ